MSWSSTRKNRKGRRPVADQSASKAKARASDSKRMSFFELEVPAEPLLSAKEEIASSRRVRESLGRIARLLPRHPGGYRRFLARMHEVLNCGAVVFSWFPRKEHLEGDHALATRALERAESAKQPKRALDRFEEGAEVLAKYKLDPETLYQWAREVVAGEEPIVPAVLAPRLRRITRVIRRSLERLEEERERLLRANYRLVMKEVFRYRPIGMNYGDLFQEGILGLQKAVFRFDPERSIRFSTYATYWIRQSIRKALIDKSRMIRVPQAVQEELRKEKTNLETKEADRIRRVMGDTILFSYGETDDSKDRFSFEIKDPATPEFGEELHTTTVPRMVHRALGNLSSRERDVLLRRFGLGGERPHTLEEIGLRLNLSRERIRQIEQEALARMRGSQDLWDLYEDLDVAHATSASTHNN